jgi:hypothetical protein
MRCVFFLQTSNLHPNKQKYKSEKKHFIFIIQNNNKNRKHIKIKNKKDKSFLKKLKHEPSLKKSGDFIVLEGHGYPLVYLYNILGFVRLVVVVVVFSIHPSRHPSHHPSIQVPHPARRR